MTNHLEIKDARQKDQKHFQKVKIIKFQRKEKKKWEATILAWK